MSNPIRVGGIGTGRVFRDAHIPVYASQAGLQLVGLFDPDRGAAEQARDRYRELRIAAFPGEELPEVVIFDSAEALLSQVELVDICTTVRHHAYYAAMALQANVHTMTEKPFARTWWEARHVAEIAHNSRALFQLNDDNVFLPRYQALRQVIESGAVGEVQAIWATRGYPGSGRPGWFWTPVEAGGGCIFDYGSHAVAATWFLLGYDKQPADVRSIEMTVRNRTRMIDGMLQQIEIDDHAFFKIRFVNPKNGDWSTVNLETTWTWPEWAEDGSDVRGYIEVQGSLGTITGFVNEQGEDFLKVTRRDLGERLLPIESAQTEEVSFRDEISHFVQCIQSGRPSMLDAEVASTVIGLLNCAQLSELRGRVSVTMAELEAWSRGMARGAADPWQAGDRIAIALNKPYKFNISSS